VRLLASFDYSRIEESLVRFAANSRRRGGVLLSQQAKLFVRDAVKVTPPNRNSRFNQAGGRRTISNDVKKVFRQSRRAPLADPAEYERFRNRRGRVRRSLGGSRVLASNVGGFIRERQEKVGILAGGWNAAARALGLALPGWITRHGTRRGSVKVNLTGDVLEVKIRNGVSFGGDVRGLERRVQWALDHRARQMEKQLVDYEARKAARQAGLRVQ